MSRVQAAAFIADATQATKDALTEVMTEARDGARRDPLTPERTGAHKEAMYATAAAEEGEHQYASHYGGGMPYSKWLELRQDRTSRGVMTRHFDAAVARFPEVLKGKMP